MKYFWEDFSPLVVIFGTVLVIVAGITCGVGLWANHTAGAQCAERAEMMKMAYSYSWRAGCMVSIQDGAWVPMSSIRVMR